MISELLNKTSFFHLLHRIDLDFSEQCKRKGCPYCNGPLHQANYIRKPRGGPTGLPEELSIRHSLCCGNESCRCRTLPPSCLFMGQRVYWSCVILISLSLHQNRTDGYSINKLMRLFDIPRKTVVRWLRYYQDAFPTSDLWRRLRGRIDCTVRDTDLPGGLLWHFIGTNRDVEKGLLQCLIFLSGARG